MATSRRQRYRPAERAHRARKAPGQEWLRGWSCLRRLPAKRLRERERARAWAPAPTAWEHCLQKHCARQTSARRDDRGNPATCPQAQTEERLEEVQAGLRNQASPALTRRGGLCFRVDRLIAM